MAFSQAQATASQNIANSTYNYAASTVATAKSTLTNLQNRHDTDSNNGYDATLLASAQTNLNSAHDLLYGSGSPLTGGCDQDIAEAASVQAAVSQAMQQQNWDAVVTGDQRVWEDARKAIAKVTGDTSTNLCVNGYFCLAQYDLDRAESLAQVGLDFGQ